jgi:hypothetical protein
VIHNDTRSIKYRIYLSFLRYFLPLCLRNLSLFGPLCLLFIRYRGYTVGEESLSQRRSGFNHSSVLCVIRVEQIGTETRLSQRTWCLRSDSIPQMRHYSFIRHRLYICLPIDAVIKQTWPVNLFKIYDVAGWHLTITCDIRSSHDGKSNHLCLVRYYTVQSGKDKGKVHPITGHEIAEGE